VSPVSRFSSINEINKVSRVSRFPNGESEVGRVKLVKPDL
jgi:hypothetical protein